MHDVIIAGGGPIGLASALMLGQAGFRVLLAERRERAPDWSRAIGVTPPSLEFLATLGVDRELVAAGVQIREVLVANHRAGLGRVGFDGLPGPYPFILSVPQASTEAVLARAVALCPGVTIRRSWQLDSLQTGPESVSARFSDPSGKLPPETAAARWLLGCDGVDSTVRRLAGIGYPGHRYGDTFVMGDFADSTGFGALARLWFTPQGAVESFPLPDGKRRWIVQTRGFVAEPPADLVSRAVRERTGLALEPAAPVWQSPFGVRRNLARRYRSGRVLLLGDAAHCLSPIGGQGMNTGFGDVEGLVPLVMADLLAPASPLMERSLRQAEAVRRRAFRIAADRAWRSMRLGTVRGEAPAWCRDRVLSLMLNGPGSARVPLDYAMLTIPVS